MTAADGGAETEALAGSSAATIELRKFTPSYETLGILIDYVAAVPPFESFEAGNLIRALRHQLTRGDHVCAFRDDRLIGYCGWANVTEEAGRRWMEGGALTPELSAETDARALTIVRADERGVVPQMIRAIRGANKGKRIFFRRDYRDGARQKRQTVLNV